MPRAFYSTWVLLPGMNCAADTAGCAVYGRLGSLLDLGAPGRHVLMPMLQLM